MKPVEFLRIAFASILENRLRSFLTMLGIMIGVGSVILLISMTAGFRGYLVKQFMGIGTNLIIISPGKTETKGIGHPGFEGVQKMTTGDTLALRRHATALDGVSSITLGTVDVRYIERERDVMVVGIDEEFTRVINIGVDSGRFFTSDDVDASRRVCTIGYTVKKELFGSKNPLGEIVKIGGSGFRVIGIMEKKGTFMGTDDIDDTVYIPVSAAQRLFNTDKLFGIRAKARSAAMVDEATGQIRVILKKRHNNKEDFTILTQGALLTSLNSILDTLSTVLAGIAAISLLVGGIGIMNIMLVSVRERTREIGIRKAVGATRRDILVQFLVESTMLSLIGGVIGILTAFIGVVVISWFIPQIPPVMKLWFIALATLFSAAVGIFFGVYPAFRAARQDPIEALRYE
ncbi:MAG: ABC transporter permease [Nitrospirae bacterium]|nr:ABC transporter permease [Nitrospirota bacterium]